MSFLKVDITNVSLFSSDLLDVVTGGPLLYQHLLHSYQIWA